MKIVPGTLLLALAFLPNNPLWLSIASLTIGFILSAAALKD